MAVNRVLEGWTVKEMMNLCLWYNSIYRMKQNLADTNRVGRMLGSVAFRLMDSQLGQT